MASKSLFLVPLMVMSLSGFTQTRNLAALKISSPPKIDGSLDETTWGSAPVARDFIQNFPKAGEPATVRSEVKILYDNSAIYIGAMLYDDPALVRKQLTARDGEQRTDVDYFSVFFDTYNDNQNGFQFLVTSANVQTDARLSANFTGDFGDYGDKTWDAVWESKTKMLGNGWSVEMRIPYFSLRFSKKGSAGLGNPVHAFYPKKQRKFILELCRSQCQWVYQPIWRFYGDQKYRAAATSKFFSLFIYRH